MSSIVEGKFWRNLLKKIFRIILNNLGLSSPSLTHNQHVVPHQEGWAIKGEGNERYTAIFDYQSDAIERAIKIAKNYQSEVIIHREEGTIRDRRSYD